MPRRRRWPASQWVSGDRRQSSDRHNGVEIWVRGCDHGFRDPWSLRDASWRRHPVSRSAAVRRWRRCVMR